MRTLPTVSLYKALQTNKCLNFLVSFHYIFIQVDLSTFEAANTVAQYEKEFLRLRQMNNARLIAKEISAYQPIQSVRILAYRNGEGRTSEGVQMVGSTLRGVSLLTLFSHSEAQKDHRMLLLREAYCHGFGLSWS